MGGTEELLSLLEGRSSGPRLVGEDLLGLVLELGVADVDHVVAGVEELGVAVVAVLGLGEGRLLDPRLRPGRPNVAEGVVSGKAERVDARQVALVVEGGPQLLTLEPALGQLLGHPDQLVEVLVVSLARQCQSRLLAQVQLVVAFAKFSVVFFQ